MEGKKTFNLYCDWWNQVKEMDDETAGKLFKLILGYVNDEHPEKELKKGDIMLILFTPYKNQLQRDLENWKQVCERNRINGLKGGRPKTQTNQENPVGYFGNPNEPKKPDKEKDKDKDKDNNIFVFKKEKEKSFYPPSIEEIKEYCVQSGFTNVDAAKFYNYYQANGWMLGTRQMVDWKAVVNYWNANNTPNNNNDPDWLKEYEQNFESGVVDL